jgi:DNA replicative helicase MCM subunit Mcm2 (Cdc46/Mcm family)
MLFFRHHNAELDELKTLLKNAGVQTANTNTYPNLRRKARQVINEQYHRTRKNSSWLNFHKGTIKKLTDAIANKKNEKRNDYFIISFRFFCINSL